MNESSATTPHNHHKTTNANSDHSQGRMPSRWHTTTTTTLDRSNMRGDWDEQLNGKWQRLGLENVSFFFVSFFLTNLFFFFWFISLLRHMFSELRGCHHKHHKCSLPLHITSTYTGKLSLSSIMSGVERIKVVMWQWQRGLERWNACLGFKTRIMTGLWILGINNLSNPNTKTQDLCVWARKGFLESVTNPLKIPNHLFAMHSSNTKLRDQLKVWSITF